MADSQQVTSQTPTTKTKNPKRVAAGKLIAEKTRLAREAQKKVLDEANAIIANKKAPEAAPEVTPEVTPEATPEAAAIAVITVEPTVQRYWLQSARKRGVRVNNSGEYKRLMRRIREK